MKIAIVNYGMGNLTSVQNAFAFNHTATEIVHDPSALKNYDKFILPGVGAFGAAMHNLQASQLKAALNEEVLVKKKPVLGLCLGMQLMFTDSNEHGQHAGFDWISGHVKDLAREVPGLRVPHVGWNDVLQPVPSILLKGLEPNESVFYFVHSYACFSQDARCVKGQVDYGKVFDVVVEKDNLFGCQFHPEKSQNSGLRVLKNFAGL